MAFSLESIADTLGLGGLFSDDKFSIDNFSAYFEGGARSYLFMWEPGSPLISPTLLNNDFRYLVRASKVPATTIEEINIEQQGINFKMAGKKSFDSWTVSFNVDKNAYLRIKFEEWSNFIQEVNTEGISNKYWDDYTSTQEFKMLDGGGDPILNIKLYGAWPKTIGEITMDYSNQDFAQFDVEFSYLYHIIE
jgi:hypothetical protein